MEVMEVGPIDRIADTPELEALERENAELKAHIERLQDAITMLGDLVMVFDEGYVRFNDDDWNRFMAVCSETPSQSLTEIKNQEREDIVVRVKYLLKRIDKTQTESNDGWWETSKGAEFGAAVLSLIEVLRESKE